MDKNPFNYLTFGESGNEAIRGTAASAYQLFMSIGAIGLLITLIVIGIKLSFGGASKRAEALDDMKWKVLTAVVLFSMTMIVSWILNIASSFGR